MSVFQSLKGITKEETAVIVFAAMLSMVVLIAPVLVNEMVSGFGLTAGQAGYIFAVEYAGMALATLPSYLWLRYDWRKVARVMLVILFVGNALTAFVHEYYLLMGIRFITAISAGSIMIICLTTAGQALNKERAYGLWLLGQLVIGAVGLAVMPRLFTFTGLWLFYALYAVACLCLYPLIKNFPAGARGVRAEGTSATGNQNLMLWGILGLAGILLYYIGLQGIWTYVGQIGILQGYSEATIGDVLAVGTILGIVGSMTATLLGGRSNTLRYVILGYVLLAGSMVVFVALPSFAAYTGAAFVFKYTWTFVLPFLMAIMANIDRNGYLISTVNLCIGGGLAIGPAVAASLLERFGSYDRVAYLLAGVVILSCVAMVATGLRSKKQEVAAPATA